MTINASAVHVVSPNTPGARRFCHGDGKLLGGAGAEPQGWLDLLPQNENGTISDEAIEVVGSSAQLGALLKAQQDNNGALWILIGRDRDADPTVYTSRDGGAVEAQWKRPSE